MEEPEDRSSDNGSHYQSELKGQQFEDHSSEDKLEEEDLIPNPSLHGLGFETMLRSVLPSKKSFRKLGVEKVSTGTLLEVMPDTLGKWTYLGKAQYLPLSMLLR